MLSAHLSHTVKKAQASLESIAISTLLAHKRNLSFKPLVSMHENSSIKDLLETLKENDITACPVFKATEDGKRVSFEF